MEWKISNKLIPYEEALAFMDKRVQAIIHDDADELVWLLEHPPLYTAGTSAHATDLLEARFPVYHTGRGGQFTYHGPGQRIAYVMLNLNKRGRDIRQYVLNLETWMIATLARYGVAGVVREGRVGVWVANQHSESKIAAIGVRVRKWVSFHGVALNIAPDLSHYAGIVPCGIREFGVTSLEALGITTNMAQVDQNLQSEFELILGDSHQGVSARATQINNVD